MGEPDSKTRNAEVTEMLDYAFAQYETEEFLSTDSVVGKVPVLLGDTTEVEIISLESVTFLNRKGSEKKSVSYELRVDALKAPLKVGDKVGKLILKEDGNITRTIPVTVKEDVQKANIFDLYIRNLKQILNGIF